MRYLKHYSLILLCTISISSFAQNLIQNSGFDNQFKRIDDELYTTRFWYLTNVNAMYFKNCAANCGAYHPARFSQYTTKKKPRSKDVFIGLYSLKNKNQRGFVGSKLITKLDSNQVYYLEMYVQLGFFSTYATNNLHVYITRDSVNLWEKESISIESKTKFKENSGIIPLQKSDKSWIIEREWTLISGFYKAYGGEQFITIGNLELNNETPKFKIMKSEVSDTIAYYFIDDVSFIKSENELANMKQGNSLVLKNILFETNKAELLAESYVALNILQKYLTDHPKTKIEISGHTDNIGTIEHNKQLSGQRAKAVVEYLVKNGTVASRLTFKGYGSSKPIADNQTEEGKEKNRRVEIMVVDK